MFQIYSYVYSCVDRLID